MLFILTLIKEHYKKILQFFDSQAVQEVYGNPLQFITWIYILSLSVMTIFVHYSLEQARLNMKIHEKVIITHQKTAEQLLYSEHQRLTLEKEVTSCQEDNFMLKRSLLGSKEP